LVRKPYVSWYRRGSTRAEYCFRLISVLKIGREQGFS
jgi:hypothetical protein